MKIKLGIYNFIVVETSPGLVYLVGPTTFDIRVKWLDNSSIPFVWSYDIRQYKEEYKRVIFL